MSAHRDRATGARITNHDLERVLTRGFRRALGALTGGAIALIAGATAAHAASPPHHGKPPPNPPAATATAPAHGHGGGIGKPHVAPSGPATPGATGDSSAAPTPPPTTRPTSSPTTLATPLTTPPTTAAPTTTSTTPPSTAAPTTTSTTPPSTDTPPASPTAITTQTTGPTPTSPPSTTPTTAAAAPVTVGNGSTNTAGVNQSPVIVVDDEQPITITGGRGKTNVSVQLGGTVATTITAVATNASDGTVQLSTGVAVNTSGSVKVTSGDPVTIGTTAGASGPPGTSATVAIGNGSTNLVLVAQSPSITVIQNIPIVLDHPRGDVTITAVIGGMVITNVTGTGSNTSNGSTQLSGAVASGTGVVGDQSAIPSLIGNNSVNTVVVIQTPTITVIYTIPIVVIDPQGSVTIHATIAPIVVTNVTGNALNGSDGNAILDVGSDSSSSTAVNLVGNDSTNTIVMVQAPTVTVLQSIPITVVSPHAHVSIDASIGGSVTTKVSGNAVNMSNGQAVVVVGGGSDSGSRTAHRTAPSNPAGATTTHDVAVANQSTNDIELTQTPQVTVTSQIPVSITGPNGLVTIHRTMGTIVSTQVRSAVQNLSAGVAALMMGGTTSGAGSSGSTGGTGSTGRTGSTAGTGGTPGQATDPGSDPHRPGAALPPTVAPTGEPHARTPTTDPAASGKVGPTQGTAITRASRTSADPSATGVVSAPTPASDSLARTGSDTSDSVPLGMALTGGGLALAELARRRRRRS